jgi:hypothetical protein
MVAYAACYWPNFLYAQALDHADGLIEWHRHMLELQAQVIKPHPT